jgi:hypothetical protein
MILACQRAIDRRAKGFRGCGLEPGKSWACAEPRDESPAAVTDVDTSPSIDATYISDD